MKAIASSLLLKMTFSFVFTASSHEFSLSMTALSSGLYHLVLTAMPWSEDIISSADILAVPVAMATLSFVIMMTSSPSFTSGDASMTPGAIRFLDSCTNLIAAGSMTTYPFVMTFEILIALCIRLMNTHFLPRSYLMDAIVLPSMMISSILSNDGALFSNTTCPSGSNSKPEPSPNCLSTRSLIILMLCSNAGLTSPGGVISTSCVVFPHLGHFSFSNIGRLHSSHHLRWFFPSLIAAIVPRYIQHT